MTTLKERLERMHFAAGFDIPAPEGRKIITQLIRAVEALEERAYPEPGVVVPWIHNLLADIEKGIVG